LLAKRLEDLDYRIAQYRRENHHESRLRRRRDALARSLEATEGLLVGLTRILKVEEGKLEQGMGLFHKGLERLMIEDLVAVENLEVFKAAGLYAPARHRLSDIGEEAAEIDVLLEVRKERHEHLEMLEGWRADLFDSLDADARAQNALLHQRLDAWLQVADRQDDLEDLSEAGEFLESTLSALEDAITAGTRVRVVDKHDLAVVSNLQPARSRQFQLLEMVHHVQLAYRTVAQLIDHLQGIEHLQVHVREPERILQDFLEALLIDHYEGGPPKHALQALTDHHKYLLQIRDGIRALADSVGTEIESLEVEEDELFHLSIDQRVRRASPRSG
jgi:hypothetical protein